MAETENYGRGAVDDADVVHDEDELEYDSAGEVYPETKSDVSNDKDAPPFPRKFEKGQRVSMTIDDGKVMRKEVFLVQRVRGYKNSYWQYRLATLDGSSYNKGAYYRENKLKKESS